MYVHVVICKIDLCIHIHWCIVMGFGHNDPWVESHMWPQQTWGQRSCRGQWPLVQVFGKKDQCIHVLWCICKSNITMIAKVCAHESRRDLWFENRLVVLFLGQFFFVSHLTYLNMKWQNFWPWVQEKSVQRSHMSPYLDMRWEWFLSTKSFRQAL